MNKQPRKEESVEENTIDEKAEQEKYERGITLIKSFMEELITLFHKSQDTFETQLSFIAGGSLSLSANDMHN